MYLSCEYLLMTLEAPFQATLDTRQAQAVRRLGSGAMLEGVCHDDGRIKGNWYSAGARLLRDGTGISGRQSLALQRLPAGQGRSFCEPCPALLAFFA